MSAVPSKAGGIVAACGLGPAFQAGDRIRIAWRSTDGEAHMPFYLRGKRGWVESVIETGAAPSVPQSRSYRLAVPLTEIWPDYVGSPRDGLRIEVVEPWLVRG